MEGGGGGGQHEYPGCLIFKHVLLTYKVHSVYNKDKLVKPKFKCDLYTIVWN